MDLVGLALPEILALAGIACLLLETLVGDGSLFIAGAALLVTGSIGMGYESVSTLGLVVLLVGSILVMYAGYRLLAAQFEFGSDAGSSTPLDSDALVGRQGVVQETVTDTDGRVELHRGGMNPMYEATTDVGTIEEGSEVIVIESGGGNVLTVAPLT